MAIAAGILSCKKDPLQATSPNSRVVKFRLYTNKNISDDNNITFSIFVREKNITLFDSTLATMQIKDIPNAANALTYEKKIYSNSILTAGFRYVIENVGHSSHLDTISANEKSKLIDYPFH